MRNPQVTYEMDQAHLLNALERIAIRAARKEVASAFGLLLNRVGNAEAETVEELHLAVLRGIGEALRDFGGTDDEPGA